MFISLLLAGCTPDEQPKAESAPPLHPDEQCEPSELPPTTLDWDDPGEGGVSAQDALGFAVGSHTATLTWDDGTTTEVTLTVTPESAIQQRSGVSSVCPVAITASAAWTLTSADGRLAPSGSAQWQVADSDWPPGGVALSATLGAADLDLAMLNPGSTRYLRVYVDDDGPMVSVQIEEVWPLGNSLNRICVRGSLDATTLTCHDTGEDSGPD